MHRYLNRFLISLLMVLPSWLAGAVQSMADGRDLLVTAGFAAALASILGLRSGCSSGAEPEPERDLD